ncbi:MAG: SH3 domain-containing protein [Firmicutes bacterium]|nr:SH3 domain-containing protein [Bacillota bacterium]
MKRKWLCGILALMVTLCVVVTVSVRTLATEESTGTYTEMKASDEFVEMLKKLEGFSGVAYWDYSQYTIGYGTRCPDEWIDLYTEDNPLPEELALELLYEELADFEAAVNSLAKAQGLTFTQNQFDALVSFSYNCGGSWVNDSSGNLYNAVVSGDTGAKFIYSMGLWTKAGGEYVLINRRMAEVNLYLNGVYSYTAPDNLRYVFLDGAGGTLRYIIHAFDADNPTEILATVSTCPTGPDEDGNTVTYVLEGWYTQREGGTKVEVLDSSLVNGTVLYAHWTTPSGTPVVIEEEDDGVSLTVTVTADGVNVRSGPRTYYASVGKVNTGDTLTITEITKYNGAYWGKHETGWTCLSYTDYADVIAEYLPRWGTVTASTLNVRSGAGTSYSSVTTKSLGERVQITEWISDGTRMWGKIDEGWVCLTYVRLDSDEEDSEASEYATGDLNRDGKVTDSDAVYLLWHVLFPDRYPVYADADMDGDGKVTDSDAVYLLWYVLFPDRYPLS